MKSTQDKKLDNAMQNRQMLNGNCQTTHSLNRTRQFHGTLELTNNRS